MLKVCFVDLNGSGVVVDARAGDTLLEVAVNNGIDGIPAECGGAFACATCHVYIDPDFIKIVGYPGDDETAMLELNGDFNKFSRLACQVVITDVMDGMKVGIAKN